MKNKPDCAFYISHEGGALSVRAFEPPAPLAHEVEIDVAYAGVNRPDLLQFDGAYPPPRDADQVLGLEVSGRIRRVGADVSTFRTGDRVCALTHGGGFRSQRCVDARHVMALPKTLTLLQGATLPETTLTVWHNLFELGRALDGQSVFIHGGNSGIGVMAITLARHFGLEVLCGLRTMEHAKDLEDMGARVFPVQSDLPLGERVKAATGGRGVDVVLDMVGGRFVQDNLKMLASEGRYVSIAFLDGARSDSALSAVMLKRLIWTGSTLRSQSAQQKARLVRAVQRHVMGIFEKDPRMLTPRVVLDPQRAGEAFDRLRAGGQLGRIVLAFDDQL